MCDYSQVIYRQCGHVRYLVLTWCSRYPRTHERCPPNIIDVDNKSHECGRDYLLFDPFLFEASSLTDSSALTSAPRDVPESFVSGRDDANVRPAAASESGTSMVSFRRVITVKDLLSSLSRALASSGGLRSVRVKPHAIHSSLSPAAASEALGVQWFQRFPLS